MEKTIIYDVETTGLNPLLDEIVQLSIIDFNENVLFSSYIKPLNHTHWKQAEAVHSISPEMVANAPTIIDVINQVKNIFNDADTIIGYNSNHFDNEFMAVQGINFCNKKRIDVMLIFSEIYGEWNEYFGNYRWQKLTTCARHYGYEFKAHDALEDVKATLFCLKRMIELGEAKL